MLKKAMTLFLVFVCAIGLSACKKDEKAEQIRQTLLANMGAVTSYHSQTSLSLDNTGKNIVMDHNEETGNTRLKQEEGGETIHLLRVNGQDMVSTDGVHYQVVDKQTITVIGYSEVLQVLDHDQFVSSKENDTLTFEGFHQGVFDDLTYAYSVKFQGFVPNEEAKQTNKDIFQMKIVVTPDSTGQYIKRIESHIKAKDDTNEEIVEIVTDFSDYNDIEPIKKPET